MLELYIAMLVRDAWRCRVEVATKPLCGLAHRLPRIADEEELRVFLHGLRISLSTHADEVLAQGFVRESSMNVATVVANALSNEEASNCDLEGLQQCLRDAVDSFASNVRKEFSRQQTGRRVSITSWRAFSRRNGHAAAANTGPFNFTDVESRFGRKERQMAVKFVDSLAEQLMRVVRQHAEKAGITMIVQTTHALARERGGKSAPWRPAATNLRARSPRRFRTPAP